MEKINLFCLPYAGGNRNSYKCFEQRVQPFVDIIPIEYPGRGMRFGEPLLSDITLIVNDLYNALAESLDHKSYALYGHSMGGLLTYLLARKIIQKGHTPPLHLFITGANSPIGYFMSQKKRHLLSRQQFIEEMTNLNGTPSEILQNEEMMDFLEPILRADFKALETYRYAEERPLDVPLTVITGKSESIDLSDLSLWQKESTHPVDFIQMPGDHFFIFEQYETLIQIISKKLLRVSIPVN